MEGKMSLDVALDIIGTLRILRMKEFTKETNLTKKQELEKEIDMLTIEERIAQGLMKFEESERVRLSIMDKIKRLYAPKLKAYYEAC